MHSLYKKQLFINVEKGGSLTFSLIAIVTVNTTITIPVNSFRFVYKFSLSLWGKLKEERLWKSKKCNCKLLLNERWCFSKEWPFYITFNACIIINETKRTQSGFRHQLTLIWMLGRISKLLFLDSVYVSDLFLVDLPDYKNFCLCFCLCLVDWSCTFYFCFFQL